jgi:hypothetical protein
LILDPSNLSYGSLIPGSAAFNYNKDNEKGTTWATVAGTNAQGGDPLIIHDLLNSDDISKLNRNREAVQTREDGKHSHVRLYLPIADMQQILKATRDNLFTDKTTPLSIDEITESLEEFLEEKLSEETFSEGGKQIEGDVEDSADEVETEGFIVTATVYDESNNEATKDLVENKDREVVVEYVAEGETSSPLFVRNDFVDAASGLPFKKLHIFTGETSDGTEKFEDDTHLFLNYNEDTDIFLIRHSFFDEDILVEASRDQLLTASEDTWEHLSQNLGLLTEDLKAYFDIYKGLLPQLASSAVGIAPFIGDVKDLNSALTGVDAISGDVLSPTERVMTGTFGSACLAANLFTGGIAGTEMHIAKEGLKLTLKAYEIHQAAKSEEALLKLAKGIERANDARLKGKMGELAAGIPQGVPKKPIKIPGTTRRRYPDFVDERKLVEVKNVQQQGLTLQLKDYISFAKEKNIPMTLHIRSNTKLTTPLKKAIEDSKINIEQLPL